MKAKARIALAATAACALALAAPAAAHVTVSPESAAADGYANLEFSVPHGCDGSSTTGLRVQIPESVPSATPQVHPGWSTRTKDGPKEEVELNGETVTEGVSEVIWTAEEEPLPDDRLDVFGMSVRLPAGDGETVYFPVIQECEDGAHRWIEIPAEGEDPESLDESAPAVTLAAADGSQSGASDGAEPADGVAVHAEQASAADDSDDPTELAVLGVVLGGVGLLAGGASLLRSRRG